MVCRNPIKLSTILTAPEYLSILEKYGVPKPTCHFVTNTLNYRDKLDAMSVKLKGIANGHVFRLELYK